MTAVHPESYPVVGQIAAKLGVDVPHLIAHPELVDKVEASTLAAGAYTVRDILERAAQAGTRPAKDICGSGISRRHPGDPRS